MTPQSGWLMRLWCHSLRWLACHFEQRRSRLQAWLEHSLLSSTIPLQPTTPPNWRQLGNEALDAGHLRDAERCYQNAVNLSTDDVAALVNLGFVKSELHLFEESRRLLERALSLDATNTDAWYLLGGILEHDKDLPAAIKALSKVIEQKPDFELAYRDLCRVYFHNGELASAKSIIQKGIERHPADPDFHFYLGNVLTFETDYISAQAYFERALVLRPDFAEAHINLGQVLEKQNRPDDALTSYQSALSLQPDHAALQRFIGNVHLMRGEYRQALLFYQRAQLLAPHLTLQDAEFLINFGLAHHHLGDVYLAIDFFRNALQLAPDHPKAHCNLGGSLQFSGQLQQAIAHYREALRLEPDYLDAHHNLLYALSFDAGCLPQEYLQEAKRFGDHISAQATAFSHWNGTSMATAAQPRQPLRPLRIGLVSGDLRNHSVGQFMEGFLGHIDSSKLTLIAYATQIEEDNLTARIKPFFAEWHVVAQLSDEQLASTIHADNVDILIDVAGHTANNRLPVFAWRPAPLQVAWLGYWASTGVTEIDYILVDVVSVPESSRAFLSEQPWYLPDTRFCFTPPVTARPIDISGLPALRKGYVTFGSFQILSKINDAVLAVWANILIALPNSRLRLQSWQLGYPAAQQDMLLRLEKVGIGHDRVDIYGGSSRDDYLDAYSEIDIILDTFPFPGGTTTVEALWMGVPTITLTGETLLARQGESILRCAGLVDWVAISLPEYTDSALSHAQDLPALCQLRAHLRANVTVSPLLNAVQFAAQFEDAMVGMWQAKFEKVQPPVLGYSNTYSNIAFVTVTAQCATDVRPYPR